MGQRINLKLLVIQILGAAWVVYHILAGEFLMLGEVESCIIHINGAVLMTLLAKGMFRKFDNTRWAPRTINLAMIAGIVISGIYIYIMMPVFLAGAVGKDFPAAVFLGFLTIVVILEGNRRLEGWIIPIVVVGCLLYARFGTIMPDLIAHADFDAKRITNLLYVGTEGLYGMIARVSFSYIGLFIIYAQFVRISGAGEFFLDFAYSVAGGVRGGPAKSAVVASSLFGMISGSAVANVAAVGCITIPLMKKTGYPKHLAGAIEAAASTGGQIMPPVMGASAFLMADFLGVSYFYVACCAFIPACLYYFSLFCAVDLEAAKRGLRGVKREELPRFKDVMRRGWHHCISPATLIYLMVVPQWTATKSAFWALMMLLAVSFAHSLIKKEKRFLKDIVWKGLVTSIEGVAMMGTISGALGVIVGIFGLTGLALKLSSIIVLLAGGSVILLLILTMITSFFFGMGLPTIAAYVLLVILVAPALENLGIPLLVSHMFVFYFGCFSVLTPPVALAAMAASTIAESDFWITGWTSTRIALVGFVLPYAFVYNPQLLLQNPSIGMVIPYVFTIAGIYALACALAGFFLYPINWYQRALLLAAAILLVEPHISTSLLGTACMAVVFVPQMVRRKRYGKEPALEMQM